MNIRPLFAFLLFVLAPLAAAQNTTVALTPAGNPAPPWAWPGGPTNALVLSGTSNSPYAITGIAQVNITMTHSFVGDAHISLEFTPSTGPGAGAPIKVDILNRLGLTTTFGSVGYSSNLGGSYTFIDPPAGQNTFAIMTNNTNFVLPSGSYRAYGVWNVPTTLSTSLAGVLGTGTWRLSFSTPGMDGGFGGGPANTVSDASVTFTSGGCPGAWSALGSGASGGFATANLPGGDVMVGDAGRYNPTTNVWSPLATRTNGNVNALAVTPSGDVIVGGSFTSAGGGSASNIARYNPTTGVWSALGTGVSGGIVYALAALPDGDVIAGGTFTSAGGVAVNRIARYNPTTNAWSAMGSGVIGGSSSPVVYAMAVLPSGDVVIAGDFFAGGGVAAGGFIRYDPTTGAWISTAGPNISNYISALAVLPGGDVIAGGTAPVFPPAGGSYLLGRYNPTTDLWTGLGLYTSGIVFSLATLPSGDVMVGGAFTTAGGVPVNGIGRCNPNTDVWTGLGSGVARPFSPSVSSIAALPNGDVIAVGNFTSAGGVAVNGIARYAFGSPAITITTHPSQQSACTGGSAAFVVTPAGTGPFTYQWRKDYIAIDTIANPSAATDVLSLSNVQAGDAGSYDCVVSALCASATSAAATLTVLDPSDPACTGCPACPADYDNNGGVDGGDLAAFFTDFENGEGCADVDNNGGVDGGDLSYFFQVFEDGGC